jgi:hypothetical protein
VVLFGFYPHPILGLVGASLTQLVQHIKPV